jgi:hypothetical protein
MGVDITAYRKVEKIADWPDGTESIDDIAEYRGLDVGYVYQGQRVTDIRPFCFPEHAAPLTDGLYTYQERADVASHSYSGYNRWRDWLSRVALGVPAATVWANFDAYRERGIAWLVNFSDCEGFIAAPVAARILADLRANEAALRASGDKWDVECFDGWLAGLDMAADGGVVEFH